MVRIQDGALTLSADILHFNDKFSISTPRESDSDFSHVFCRLLYPNGLPDEYSIVTTIRARRTTKKDRWYLWQIFDQTGGSQVSQAVSGVDARISKSQLTITLWLKSEVGCLLRKSKKLRKKENN